MANVDEVRILNTRDWDAYNKTRKTSAMYVLSLNIPLGGHRTFLRLIFREGEPVKVEGDINELTMSKLIKNWHELKANMERYCEAAIRSFNTKCKRNIDEMAKLQDRFKSFEV